MLKSVKHLLKDEQGQGMTEYGLVLGLIAVAVVGLLALFRNEIIELFDDALGNIRGREDVAETVPVNN